MTTFRSRLTAALALAAVSVGTLAGPAGASQPPLVPDDLAFLNSPVVDDVIADAEGGRVECAALSSVLGIAFAAALVTSDWDFGDPEPTEVPATTEAAPTAEAVWAVSAPLLVPLLDRVSSDDPAGAALVEILGPDLVAAVYELRDQGLSDDDLLLIQESFAVEMIATEPADGGGTDPAPDDSAMADLGSRLEALISHDFESITFVDDDMATSLTGEGNDALPWHTECPESADMFDVGADADVPASVSASVDFEVVVTVP